MMNTKHSISGVPQAHVAYAEQGNKLNPPLGIIKLEPQRVTFTSLKGEKIVDIPLENVKRFGVGAYSSGGVSIFREYRFKIQTKDSPAKKHSFRTWTNHLAYDISKEELRKELKQPVRLWTTPLKAKGVKVENYNTAVYVLMVVLALFIVCMVAVFLVAQRNH